MISDSAYMEAIKNCSKWNSRIMGGKKRSNIAVFDQQTGVVQRPSTHLFRHYTERCMPKDPLQVVAYPSATWTRPKDISSDAIELKYFLNSSPALHESIVSLSNPNTVIPSTTNEFNLESSSSMRSMYGRYDINDVDISEYDIEEPENDPSDEDDWVSNKKKRRKTNPPGSLNKPKRNNTNLNGNNSVSAQSSIESRPFVCQICGAKYKSRPGLTYHKSHVHQESTNQSVETSKSPSMQVSQIAQL